MSSSRQGSHNIKIIKKIDKKDTINSVLIEGKNTSSKIWENLENVLKNFNVNLNSVFSKKSLIEFDFWGGWRRLDSFAQNGIHVAANSFDAGLWMEDIVDDGTFDDMSWGNLLLESKGGLKVDRNSHLYDKVGGMFFELADLLNHRYIGKKVFTFTGDPNGLKRNISVINVGKKHDGIRFLWVVDGTKEVFLVESGNGENQQEVKVVPVFAGINDSSDLEPFIPESSEIRGFLIGCFELEHFLLRE